MATLYEELVSNLNEQLGYYEELKAISEEKTNVIVKNNIDDLTKINTVENMLIVRLEKLDKKNKDILNDIIMVTGKKVDRVSVKCVAQLLSSEEGTELENVADKIIEAVQELKNVNEKNKLLVNTSLEYAEYTMNVYRDIFDTSIQVTYDKNGKIDN